MDTRIGRGCVLFTTLAWIMAAPLVARASEAVLGAAIQHPFQFNIEPGARDWTEDISGHPLTLEETLHIFREHGLDLAIADASVALADADVISASAIANPSLSLSRGNSSTYDPAQCSGCSSTSVGAGITDGGALSDLGTGKRRLRVAVARAARDAAKSARADIARTVELAVKQQLLQAELFKRSLHQAQENQNLAVETLSIVSKRYEAGAVSEADVARADVQKLEADQSVDSATQNLAAAKAELAFLLGLDAASASLDVSDDLLRVELSPDLANADRTTVFREALEHRPDLLRASAQVERARSALVLARRLWIPDVLPSLNYSSEGRGQNAIQPPTVTLGLAATLPVFSHYRGDVARAEADLLNETLSLSKVRTQVSSDVVSATAALQSASRRVMRMDHGLLDRARRARDLVHFQYQKGAVSLFEYLDAQRVWLATEAEYLQTINDYWNAVFQLEAATAKEFHG